MGNREKWVGMEETGENGEWRKGGAPGPDHNTFINFKLPSLSPIIKKKGIKRPP